MRVGQKLLLRFLVVLFSATLSAHAVTNQNGVVTQFDPTTGNLFILKTAAGTQTNIMTIPTTGGTFLPPAYTSMRLSGAARAYTAAASFERVTNMTIVANVGGLMTATTSNQTTLAAADWFISIDASFSSSAVNNTTDGHFFTNGVDADIGWSRKIATANDQGSAAGSGILLDVPSNTVFTFRLDVDKNSTITFDHLHCYTTRVGP